MSKVKFELDLKGLNQLMKSSEMQAVLQQAGERVASRAEADSGEPYGVRVHTASFVAIANVYPDSEGAKADNFENNTVLKALTSSGLPLTKRG